MVMHLVEKVHMHLSVSVTGNQWKKFDLETQGVVSLVEQKKLELGNLCEHQSRH